MRTSIRFAAAAAFVLGVNPLYAQQVASIFAQATIGRGTSAGGEYVERDEYTAEVMLGRIFSIRKHPVAFGTALGGSFVNGSDLICRFAADGGCVPSMPRFGYVALLAGLDAHGSAGGVDIMAGPALLTANSTTRIGAQLRADFASPSIFHASIVASPRLALVPGFEGANISLRSFSIGVRFR